MQLGWLPRLRITQTSALGYGQIYVGTVNWLMMIVTIGLTLVFRKSDNLAAAYVIAVSATMLMTSVLLYMAMRQYLRWSLPLSAAVAGGFLIVDSAFFLSNAAKIAEAATFPWRSPPSSMASCGFGIPGALKTKLCPRERNQRLHRLTGSFQRTRQ